MKWVNFEVTQTEGIERTQNECNSEDDSLEVVIGSASTPHWKMYTGLIKKARHVTRVNHINK